VCAAAAVNGKGYSPWHHCLRACLCACLHCLPAPTWLEERQVPRDLKKAAALRTRSALKLEAPTACRGRRGKGYDNKSGTHNSFCSESGGSKASGATSPNFVGRGNRQGKRLADVVDTCAKCLLHLAQQTSTPCRHPPTHLAQALLVALGQALQESIIREGIQEKT